MLIALVVASTLLGEFCCCSLVFFYLQTEILKKCDAKSDLRSDAANGISIGSILDKFASLKVGGGSIAAIEYPLLVAATNNFYEGNVLCEGGFGGVFKAHFNENVQAVFAGGQEAEREFENEVE